MLDMGTPVKIDDLARNMIKLTGLKPDDDIKIVYTGLRPGEKLYEAVKVIENSQRDINIPISLMEVFLLLIKSLT